MALNDAASSAGCSGLCSTVLCLVGGCRVRRGSALALRESTTPNASEVGGFPLQNEIAFKRELLISLRRDLGDLAATAAGGRPHAHDRAHQVFIECEASSLANPR